VGTIREHCRLVFKAPPGSYFLSRSCEDYLFRQHDSKHLFCPRCGQRTSWNIDAKSWICPAGHDEARNYGRRHLARWAALLKKYQPRRRTPDYRNDDHRRL
jgi:hypothetical protein